MQQFYFPNIDSSTIRFSFDEIESKHLIKVLRKNTGDKLVVTNGKGWIFEGVIEVINVKKCDVIILNAKQSAPLPYQLHIAIAPTKNIQRFEWFLEKSTEIGVTEITPIICERSERKKINNERLQKIITSALKQSLGTQLPVLHPPEKLKDFITTHSPGFIAHCENSEKKYLAESIDKKSSYTILIGPEGDFSPQEIEMALHQNNTAISLGNSRLRTETAGIVACQTVALVNQLN